MATRYSPKIITDGLVLCLDAANTRSYSGSGSDFIDIAGPQGTSWSRGAIDGATFIPHSSTAGPACFDFDGTNDKVTFTIPDVDIYCFQIAIRFDDIASKAAVGFTVGGVHFNGMTIGPWTGNMDDETIVWWGYGTGAGTGAGTYIKTAVSTDWHIITANWTGSTSTGYDILIDGVKQTVYGRGDGIGHSGPFDGTNGYGAVTAMHIGWNEGWNNYFNGKIAFARAYNKQLTDAQILQNYIASKGRLEL